MHHHERREEVQQRRDGCGLADLDVRNVDVSAMMNATAPITGGMIWPPMLLGRLDAAGERRS